MKVFEVNFDEDCKMRCWINSNTVHVGFKNANLYISPFYSDNVLYHAWMQTKYSLLMFVQLIDLFTTNHFSLEGRSEAELDHACNDKAGVDNPKNFSDSHSL